MKIVRFHIMFLFMLMPLMARAEGICINPLDDCPFFYFIVAPAIPFVILLTISGVLFFKAKHIKYPNDKRAHKITAKIFLVLSLVGIFYFFLALTQSY